MKTAGEFRAEAQHLREIAENFNDPRLLDAIRQMIDELEARARELDNGT
jgi:hypothetical protein